METIFWVPTIDHKCQKFWQISERDVDYHFRSIRSNGLPFESHSVSLWSLDTFYPHSLLRSDIYQLFHERYGIRFVEIAVSVLLIVNFPALVFDHEVSSHSWTVLFYLGLREDCSDEVSRIAGLRQSASRSAVDHLHVDRAGILGHIPHFLGNITRRTSHKII